MFDLVLSVHVSHCEVGLIEFLSKIVSQIPSNSTNVTIPVTTTAMHKVLEGVGGPRVRIQGRAFPFKEHAKVDSD